MNFQFSAPTTTTANTGFSFAMTTAAASIVTDKPTLSFGNVGGGDSGAAKAALKNTTNTTSWTAPAPAPAAVGTGFFNKPATTAPALGGIATAAAAGAAATTVPTGAAAPAFSFGLTTTTTTAVAATPAGSSTTSLNAAVTSSTFTKPSSTTLELTTTPATATLIPTSSSGGFASLTTATKTTDSSAVSTASQISYNQLEEHINKWLMEFEEQEKVFTDQATQINAWDKILMENNGKILELNAAVHKVKTYQQALEQELEFITTQHKELEETLAPLQKEFMNIPQVDVERSHTYLMVENLDSQLKQMSEDLNEIIDSLNESNKFEGSSDPIIKIGKILNAHMRSLQWVESTSTELNHKLEEITKMHESFKRDSERSFRMACYD